MSKSTRRTIADIEDECGYDYGTSGFRDYVNRIGIDVVADKKRLKAFSLERRNREKKEKFDEM